MLIVYMQWLEFGIFCGRLILVNEYLTETEYGKVLKR
jgi:hypothetical protein